MKEWFCNLLIQLLLGRASAVTLVSKFRRARDHILLSHLRLLSLSVTSYASQGYGGGILVSVKSKSMSKLSYNWQSVGQSFMVLGHHPEPMTNFSFTSMEYIFRHLWFSSCGVLSLTEACGCNLSDNCYWALPVLSLLGPSTAGFMTISYCLIWDGGSLSCCLLWLAELWWRYSNPPPYRCHSSQSHLTTDSQSASPFQYQATIWDLRPIFFLFHNIHLQIFVVS
jgi:hypothetical protein